MKKPSQSIVACPRAMVALVLGAFPATARAHGGGLEYIIFGLIALLPAVLILFVLMSYVVTSGLMTRTQRKTLVRTYAATSALAGAVLLLIGHNNLSFIFSPAMWIGPLIIFFWQRSKFT